MPTASTNWLAKLFPTEWYYIAKKSNGPRDLKSLAKAFYQVEKERIIDDDVKYDVAKFFNPVKPLNLGLRFLMNKIQDYVDYNLLREKDHDYLGISLDIDFSASTLSQRLLKGILLLPLLIISAPLRLMDKVVDAILSSIGTAGKAIINSNKTTFPILKTEQISILVKNKYATEFNHATKSIDAIDPLRVINPARLINLSLSILIIQTAGVIDNLFPGQNHLSRIPARILKGLIITPLIILNTPIAILDNVTDALLLPFKPFVELIKSPFAASSPEKNTTASEAPVETSTALPPKTSFRSTAAKLVKEGVASLLSKPDFSEHGLAKSEYKQLKRDPDNKADLKSLHQLH